MLNTLLRMIPHTGIVVGSLTLVSFSTSSPSLTCHVPSVSMRDSLGPTWKRPREENVPSTRNVKVPSLTVGEALRKSQLPTSSLVTSASTGAAASRGGRGKNQGKIDESLRGSLLTHELQATRGIFHRLTQSSQIVLTEIDRNHSSKCEVLALAQNLCKSV